MISSWLNLIKNYHSKQNSSKTISRYGFLGTSAVTRAGFTIIPRQAVAGLAHIALSDKLNIAAVGIGGMGRNNVDNVGKTENIAVLCDVDWSGQTLKVFEKYPDAKCYKD